MKRYATPDAMRAALDARLNNESRALGLDIGRLRRLAVFERILVRMNLEQPGAWILKGGVALEVRFRERARTTKDLDLTVMVQVENGDALRETLIDILAADPEGDGFTFEVSAPQTLTADAAGNSAFRFSVRSILARKTFSSFRMDVAPRPDELLATESLALPGVLEFAGFPRHEATVSAIAQTIAEKVHAMTLPRGDRENTRVRDLVDIVFLIEGGFDDAAAVSDAASHVFGIRDTHELPSRLPDPPAVWEPRFVQMATEMELAARNLDDAIEVARQFWSRVVPDEEAE